MAPEVITDLSTDQMQAYRLCQAVRSGVFPPDLANLKCGPTNHARWLTTANRILSLWLQKYNFHGTEFKNLEMLVEWLVGCYYPMWFRIKIHHHWLQGPHHILANISMWRQQKKVVIYITKDTVMRGSWFAHSEMILQTMISSDSEEDRRFAIKKILEVREKTKKGNKNKTTGKKNETKTKKE